MSKRVRYQYWVDDFNRLRAQKKSSNGRLLGKPVILNGYFELDRKKYLRYRLKTPGSLLKDLGIRSKGTALFLKGRWSLTPEHKLRYSLFRNQGELILKTDLLESKSHQMIFSLTTRDNAKTFSTQIFSFEGRWQTDRYNRFSFVLTNRKSRRDRLTFQGAWEVNKHHQLIYRYYAEGTGSGKRKKQTVLLKGFWSLNKKGFLNYSLEASPESQFRFRAQYLGYRSVRKNASTLRFRVGILARGSGKKVFRSIELFGRWKIYNRLSLGFEIEYEKGVVEEIRFKVRFKPGRRETLDVDLLTRRGHKLGIVVTFSKQFFEGKTDLFIRAQKRGRQRALETGVKIPW